MSREPETNVPTEHGGPVTDLLKEFLQFASRQSRDEIVRVVDHTRASLQRRQLRRDRSAMLEKLGREVCALVDGGEVDHPGLIRGARRIATLDASIEDGMELDAVQGDVEDGEV